MSPSCSFAAMIDEERLNNRYAVQVETLVVQLN
jgi:hypothetical protein